MNKLSIPSYKIISEIIQRTLALDPDFQISSQYVSYSLANHYSHADMIIAYQKNYSSIGTLNVVTFFPGTAPEASFISGEIIRINKDIDARSIMILSRQNEVVIYNESNSTKESCIAIQELSKPAFTAQIIIELAKADSFAIKDLISTIPLFLKRFGFKEQPCENDISAAFRITDDSDTISLTVGPNRYFRERTTDLPSTDDFSFLLKSFGLTKID